jgi:aryl-alcohol dehydrogenase-like predicted oxidoreductase
MYPTVISARSLGYKKQLRHEGPGSMTWIRGGPLELDRANIIAGVEGSLKRLGTDYIDLLLLHWPDRYVPMFGGSEYDVSNVYDFCPFEEQIKTLNTLQGKIIQFGLGNETAYGVAKFSSLCDSIPGGLRLSVVQNAYSPLCRTFASSGLGQIRAMKGVGLAYSPLAKGLLSGKHDDHGASADPEARLVKFKGVRRSRVEVRAKAKCV